MTKAVSVGMKRIAALRLVPSAVLNSDFNLNEPRNRCQAVLILRAISSILGASLTRPRVQWEWVQWDRPVCPH